jgi:hypothetical protein
MLAALHHQARALLHGHLVGIHSPAKSSRTTAQLMRYRLKNTSGNASCSHAISSLLMESTEIAGELMSSSTEQP